MTELQQKVYDYLLDFFENNQRFPTLEELRKALRFKSTSQAQAVMNRLKKQKLVTWLPGRPGTLQMIGYRARLEEIED